MSHRNWQVKLVCVMEPRPSRPRRPVRRKNNVRESYQRRRVTSATPAGGEWESAAGAQCRRPVPRLQKQLAEKSTAGTPWINHDEDERGNAANDVSLSYAQRHLADRRNDDDKHDEQQHLLRINRDCERIIRSAAAQKHRPLLTRMRYCLNRMRMIPYKDSQLSSAASVSMSFGTIRGTSFEVFGDLSDRAKVLVASKNFNATRIWMHSSSGSAMSRPRRSPRNQSWLSA